MIAADTNLIVRYLIEDDAPQVEKALALFDGCETRQEAVFLSHIVLCEICWVLEAAIGLDRRAIALALDELLADTAFVFQDRALVEEALKDFRRLSGQFADHLIGIVAREAGASTTYTFDKAIGKLPTFTLLK